MRLNPISSTSLLSVPLIDDQAEPQDRTKAAKMSEHRRRAPIQFMLNKTSQAGQRSGCKQTTFGACLLHRAGVDRYNFG
jgi:hypothetical protein